MSEKNGDVHSATRQDACACRLGKPEIEAELLKAKAQAAEKLFDVLVKRERFESRTKVVVRVLEIVQAAATIIATLAIGALAFAFLSDRLVL